MDFQTICLVFSLCSCYFGAVQLQNVQNYNETNAPDVGRISKEVFYIQSPKYPSAYTAGSKARWTIVKSDWTVCSMTLVVRDFQMFGTCQDNYLSIGDKTTLCGTLSSRRLEIKLTNNPSAMLQVDFQSSVTATSGRGFNILVIQHPHTCTGPVTPLSISDCSKTFSDDQGIFGASEYLNQTLKPPMKECILTFSRPLAAKPSYCGVRFSFLLFDLGSNCDLDNLYVQGKRYCGQQLLKEDFIIPYPNDTSKDLEFVLNIRSKNFAGGFIANYQRVEQGCPVICSKVFSEASFNLKSPGQPLYLNNADCEYTVRKANSDIRCLQVKVNKLQFAAADETCSTDYIKLFENRRICKFSQLPIKTFKVSFPVRQNVLTAKFHSDGSGSSAGFDIDIQQLKGPCPPDQCQKISGSGVMSSPDYPNPYPKHLQCEYFIERMTDAPMELMMYKVNYRTSTTTSLTLPGGKSLDNIFANNDQYSTSVLNSFGLNFRSLATADSGFQIFVRQVPLTLKPCPSQPDLTAEKGDFRTPLYSSGTYPVNQTCIITIVRYASNCKVILMVKNFEMAPADPTTRECNDYVDWSRDGRKCGTLTAQQFGKVDIPFGNGNKVFIKFVSDSIVDDNKHGVDFEYMQSSENC